MRRIGQFNLDSNNHCVWRGETAVPLSSKAFAILDFLSERPGQLVTHDELLDAVWPATHVQPEVLKVYIFELRQAFGDTARKPQYIETVFRRGYRLLANTADDLRSSLAGPGVSPLFVNRHAELDFLDRKLQSASAGRRELVFIRGETGVGKSALLEQLLSRAAKRPGTWLAYGSCIRDSGETEPFAPIIEALNRLIGSDKQHPLIGFLRQAAPCWLLQFPNLLDVREREDLGRELAGSTSQRMIRELCAAMDLVCASHPFVIAIDDLHWADIATLHIIEALTVRNEPAPLFLLGTYRSGPTAGQIQLRRLVIGLQRRRLCNVMNLGPLPETTLRTYVESRFPSGVLNNELTARIYRVSGGVPLFFTTCVDYLQAQLSLLNAPDTWNAARESIAFANELPDTLQELVELKLSQLDREVQAVLEAASLIGLEFSARLVGAALERESDHVEDVCNRLVRAGGWLRCSGFDETDSGHVTARFSFVHDLLRDALHGRQTVIERVKRHLRVACAMEAELGVRAAESASTLARHFEAGQEHLRGIYYLRKAAQDPDKLFSDAGAAALLIRALDMATELPEPAREFEETTILSGLGEVYLASGDLKRAARAWEQIVPRAIKSKRIEVAATALLKTVLPFSCATVKSLRSVVDTVLKLRLDIQDPLARARITVRALLARGIAIGWSADDSAECRKAVEVVADGGDSVEAASAQISYTWFQLGESAYQEAILAIQEGLPVVTTAGRFEDVLRGKWGLAWALLHAGEWKSMREVVSSIILLAAKHGNETFESAFTYLLAWLHVECGASDMAIKFCASAQQLDEKSGSAIGPNIGDTIYGLAELGIGRAEAALSRFERVTRSRVSGPDLWFVISQIGVVESLLAQRDVVAIESAVKSLRDHIVDLSEKTWTALAFRSCARAAAAGANWNQAARDLDEALRLVRESNLPLATWRVYETASEIYSKIGPTDRSDAYKEQGRASSLSLAASLYPDDELTRRFAEFSGIADRIGAETSAPVR